jgi:hypothetical protein
MDKEVLIRFIQMIETVLSRVNSKRMITLFGFLYWLYAVKETIGMNWTAATGAGLSLIVVASFIEEAYKRKGSDALDAK